MKVHEHTHINTHIRTHIRNMYVRTYEHNAIHISLEKGDNNKCYILECHLLSTLAKPKSQSLIIPFLHTRIFSGLTSRWIHWGGTKYASTVHRFLQNIKTTHAHFYSMYTSLCTDSQKCTKTHTYVRMQGGHQKKN